MARELTRCPRCGERVSPFAAGCALCGADLESARIRRSRSRVAVPSVRHPALPSLSASDWLQIVIALVLAVAAPPIGILLGLYWAYVRRREGRPVLAAVMLAAVVISAAAFFAPVWFWSRLAGV